MASRSFITSWKTEVPTPETINKFFEEFISNISSDMLDDYFRNLLIVSGVESKFNELLKVTSGKKINKVKNNKSFIELCYIYNDLLDIYKKGYHASEKDLNERIIFYKRMIKEFNMLFEII